MLIFNDNVMYADGVMDIVGAIFIRPTDPIRFVPCYLNPFQYLSIILIFSQIYTPIFNLIN